MASDMGNVKVSFGSYEHMQYDYDKGELNIFSEFVREQIKVRASLADDAIRAACIYELEKLGYTIISPENTYVSTSEEQFRVETAYRSDPERWAPEGDHRVFTTREAAEDFMSTKAEWYDNPERFKHRITRRTVTSWEPIR